MSELPKFVVDHLRNAQPIGEHPDADLLTAFAEQSLGERERTSVLLHLSTCPDCREMTTLVMGREPAEVLVPRCYRCPFVLSRAFRANRTGSRGW
jgi:hypothetical protein